MGFCTKCGKQLRENDKFCFHCGTPVPEIQRENQQEPGQKGVDTVEPGQKAETDGVPLDSQRAANIKIFIIVGIILVLVIGCAILKMNTGKSDFGMDGEQIQYDTYTNTDVCFLVNYPQGYQVTEPNTNNVVITEGSDADFQVVIEYAYHTVSNSAIYSAEDFVRQIEADSTVLTDWIGAPEVNVISQQETMVAGMKCYEYCFEFQMEGHKNAGQMYIFDGMGNCGCYTYMTVINENAEEAERYRKQNETMKESFRITAQCMPEGYQIYDYEEIGLQFMVRDEALAETKESTSGEKVVVYPVEGVFTECSIWITESAYDIDHSMQYALESGCNYYFDYKDNTQFISEVTELSYGRYPCMGIDLQYYEDGLKQTASRFVLKVGDSYWNVNMETTDAYYDTAAAATSDILFSIMFDQFPVASDTNTSDNIKQSASVDSSQTTEQEKKATAVSDIVSQIENSTGYVENSGAQGILKDMNQDGIKDFLVTYVAKNSNGGFDVMYEVWTLPESGAVKLKSGVVYTQVGGNSGYVGVVQKDNIRYLEVTYSEPAGECFNQYCAYYEWDSDDGSIDDGGYYLESHGQYDDEKNGRYIWGDQEVDYNTFKQHKDTFSDCLCKLNILSTPGDGGTQAIEDFK